MSTRKIPLYQERRETVLAMSDQATEDEWIELSVRWHEGDLADTRYPMSTREMAWFLLVTGDLLVGATERQAVAAGHYAGYEVERTGRGWAMVRKWKHR
jgi:hypothetical protein